MKTRTVKFTWWYCIVMGLAAIADGLSMIFTLGYYATSLQLRFAMWGARKNFYRK